MLFSRRRYEEKYGFIINYHLQYGAIIMRQFFLLFDSFNFSTLVSFSYSFKRFHIIQFFSCGFLSLCKYIAQLNGLFYKYTNSTYQDEHLNIHKIPYDLTFCTYLYIHMYMRIYTQLPDIPIIHFIYPLKQQWRRNKYELIIVYWTKLHLRLKVKYVKTIRLCK